MVVGSERLQFDCSHGEEAGAAIAVGQLRS